jgi:hypothetical protein
MNFFTHLKMADTIFEILNGDIIMDRKQFRYGNVLPDLDKSMNNIKHTFEGSIGLVEGVCTAIASERLDIGEFSRNLGIITHFACDYFCRYHLDDEKHDDYFDHFFYEAKLHSEYMFIKDDLNLTEGVHITGGRDVRTIIMDLRKSYQRASESSENDILFAIGAALSTCEIVVRQQALSGFKLDRENFTAVMIR